jgi:hypothetical protein
MSSTSIAFVAWAMMESASRARTAVGAFESTSILKRVVVAADAACWSRATHWPKVPGALSR